MKGVQTEDYHLASSKRLAIEEQQRRNVSVPGGSCRRTRQEFRAVARLGSAEFDMDIAKLRLGLTRVICGPPPPSSAPKTRRRAAPLSRGTRRTATSRRVYLDRTPLSGSNCFSVKRIGAVQLAIYWLNGKSPTAPSKKLNISKTGLLQFQRQSLTVMAPMMLSILQKDMV